MASNTFRKYPVRDGYKGKFICDALVRKEETSQIILSVIEKFGGEADTIKHRVHWYKSRLRSIGYEV